MKTTNHIARFRGGAKRRDLKPRFDLIPLEFLESVAHVLTSGAVQYGPYNWKRGQKDFFLEPGTTPSFISRGSRKVT